MLWSLIVSTRFHSLSRNIIAECTVLLALRVLAPNLVNVKISYWQPWLLLLDHSHLLFNSLNIV